MVVVALLSVDLVESVDLVSVVLVVNCIKINESYLFTIVLSLWLYNQDKITGACKNHLIFSPYRKAIKIAFCYAN